MKYRKRFSAGPYRSLDIWMVFSFAYQLEPPLPKKVPPPTKSCMVTGLIHIGGSRIL